MSCNGQHVLETAVGPDGGVVLHDTGSNRHQGTVNGTGLLKVAGDTAISSSAAEAIIRSSPPVSLYRRHAARVPYGRLRRKAVPARDLSLGLKMPPKGSFDDLVSLGEQDRRHADPESIGGFEVDDELKLDLLLDR